MQAMKQKSKETSDFQIYLFRIFSCILYKSFIFFLWKTEYILYINQNIKKQTET